jgi:hypothetical protein
MHKTTIGLTFLYLEPWGEEAGRTAGDENAILADDTAACTVIQNTSP